MLHAKQDEHKVPFMYGCWSTRVRIGVLSMSSNRLWGSGRYNGVDGFRAPILLRLPLLPSLGHGRDRGCARRTSPPTWTLRISIPGAWTFSSCLAAHGQESFRTNLGMAVLVGVFHS